jgi:hypothetical protein
VSGKTCYALAIALTCTVQNARSQSEPNAAHTKPARAATYLVTPDAADKRFFYSIERLDRCDLKQQAMPHKTLTVPWEIYPAESVGREEGTVVVLLKFDADHCVRKASVIHTSKFWRLDNVTLKWAMLQKFIPEWPVTVDGEPAILMKIAWGESQEKHH